MLPYMIALLLVAIPAIYYFLIRPHSFWSKRGVKQGKPMFILGHNTQLSGKHSLPDMISHIYSMYPKDRYSGMYMLLKPVLVLRDPDLIKQITVKDFDHFTDHMTLLPDNYDSLWTMNLFNLRGEKWRNMRATLSPAFTGSKMKAMFSLMRESAEQFCNYFDETLGSNGTDVELKDLFTRFTNDVIATCAFGINCDSLRERDNEFYRMGKETTDLGTFKKRTTMLLMVLAPKLYEKLGLSLFGKHVEQFFLKIVKDAIKYREEHNIVRPDLIHIMMEARKGQLEHDAQETCDTGIATVHESAISKENTTKLEMTLEVMTAQALLFFFAGFDSVATLMCFAAYEIAVNPDVQRRLRAEIHSALQDVGEGGKITYDQLNKMKYLDMVVAETLRKWPSGVAADRSCTKDYTIATERTDEVPIVLRKGDAVWLPYFGIHRDPHNYPDPERFDPERFSDENKANIKAYTYFPFGSGPRNCIASRFALLETKTLMFHLFNSFELYPIEKTPIPMVISKRAFTLNPEAGFWIGIKPLQGSAKLQ